MGEGTLPRIPLAKHYVSMLMGTKASFSQFWPSGSEGLWEEEAHKHNDLCRVILFSDKPSLQLLLLSDVIEQIRYIDHV